MKWRNKVRDNINAFLVYFLSLFSSNLVSRCVSDYFALFLSILFVILLSYFFYAYTYLCILHWFTGKVNHLVWLWSYFDFVYISRVTRILDVLSLQKLYKYWSHWQYKRNFKLQSGINFFMFMSGIILLAYPCRISR